MALDPVSVLQSAVFVAVAVGIYGWVVAFFWSPFLLSRRIRKLLDVLPPRNWQWNYALWMPLPGATWGFIWGATLAIRSDLQPPEATIGAAAFDGLVAATGFSLLLWPAVLLVGLPGSGYDWYPDNERLRTALLVIGWTTWYLLFIVVPMYYLSLLAGIGGAMTGG